MMYDVIIIGAGSIGMATGYYLSKQGATVLLLDEYDPPHTEGSHHGDTRIIRHAYGEGKHYVELALHSQQLWEALAENSDEDIFKRTGVVNVGKENSVFMQGVLESADTYRLSIEQLTAEEMSKRWKGWQLPNDYIACYEKTSGVIKSDASIRSFRQGIERNGGEVKGYQQIKGIQSTSEYVNIATATEQFSARKLLITAGAGTNHIVGYLGVKLPLKTVRKTFSWFHHPDKLFHERDFPAFTCETDLGTYYGFPNIDGAGVKIGRHDGGRERDMSKPNALFGTFKEDEEDVATFARTFMSNELTHYKGLPCTYTLSPDNDFIIDTLPKYDRINIACGFSGHGFKFSSGLGETLSRILVDKKNEMDLSTFSLARFS